jgi:hypothetical protein
MRLRSRGQRVRRARQPRCLTTPYAELLEARRLLTPGIYLENFENDPTNPTGPVDPATAVGGFDAAGDFMHTLSSQAYSFHRVTGITTPQAMPTLPFDLVLAGTDTIRFPHVDVANGESVVLASVLVGPVVAQSTVQFVGQTDTLTRVYSFGNTWQKVTASTGDPSDAGRPLGPITSIVLEGFDGGEFDDVSIFVQGQGANLPPTATGAVADTLPNTPTDIDVSDLGTDPDGDPLTISAVTSGATINGTFVPTAGTVVNNGQFVRYTPPMGFHGTDDFGYTIDDGHGSTASGTVVVHVNTPPIAPDESFSVPHGTTGSFTVPGPGLLSRPSDPDGDPLTVTASDGALGHVAANATTGGFTYTSNGGGLVRADQFTYTVSDGLATASGTVALVPVNQPPPAAAPLTEHVAHGTFGPLTFPAPGLVAVNPTTDADGDTLRPVLDTNPSVTQPASGQVTINANGSFTYTRDDPTLPDPSDAFSYALFDGYVMGPPATVHIVVPDNPPVAHVVDLMFPHSQLGQSISLGTLTEFFTDADGDPLRLVSATVTGGGTLMSNAQGALTFVPAIGQTYLSDSTAGTIGVQVTLTVTDGYTASNAAEINLSYVNTPPVAQDLRVDVVDAGAIFKAFFYLQELNGYENGSPQFLDPDGDKVHAILVTNPANGSIDFQDGAVTYIESRPLVTDSFTYKLTDGYVESNTATVTLVPNRAEPMLYPAELASTPGQTTVSRDPLSSDYFQDLTPVFGHGQAILDQTDRTFRLFDLAGNEIQPGDVIDFKNGFKLVPSDSQQTTTHIVTYKVRYNLNDDPVPPTAVSHTTTTVTIVSYQDPQSDTDGVSDTVENGAPNGGDGNLDGIPDSQEDNVASLPDSTDGQYVTLASDPSTYLAEVKATLNPSPSDVPPGYEFPLGFFTFKLFGPFFSTVGGVKQQVNSTVVDLISPIELPQPPNFHYFRYGKTPDDPTDHWYDWTYDGQTGAEFLSTHEIRLHFVDGARGDDDRMQNGVIMDAGGPAIVALPPVVTVKSLEPTKVKVTVGAGKRARTKPETALLLEFSDDLAGTGNAAAYQLLTGKTKKGSTTFHTRVPLTVFDSTPTSVTLLPRHKLKRSLPEQLRLVASDLTDATGRPLQGGQSFAIKFGKNVVTNSVVQSQSRVGIRPASAVDAVPGSGRPGPRLPRLFAGNPVR